MSVLSGIRKAIAAVREFAKKPDFLAEYQVQPKTGIEPVFIGEDQKKVVDFGKAEHVFSAVRWNDYGYDYVDMRIDQTSFYRTRKGAWVRADFPGLAKIVSQTEAWEGITGFRKDAEDTKALTGQEIGRTIVKHDSLGDAAEILKGVEEA